MWQKLVSAALGNAATFRPVVPALGSAGDTELAMHPEHVLNHLQNMAMPAVDRS